jgi:hypothetical protein
MWFRSKQKPKEKPVTTIDYKWLEEITRNGHTPDIAELSNRKGAVVFIYNDLKKKFKDHHILNPIVHGGDSYTLDHFNGWYRKSDHTPIMLPKVIETHKPVWSIQTTAHAAAFKGELHVVSIQTLKELDKYHTNGVEFIRRRIEIHVPCEEDIMNKDHVVIKSGEFHRYIKAWAYVGNLDYFWHGKDSINNYEYEPMKIFTPNKGWRDPYYFHPRS